MQVKKGDIVSRYSYNNDILFFVGSKSTSTEYSVDRLEKSPSLVEGARLEIA